MSDLTAISRALLGHINTLRLSGRDDGMVEDMQRAADEIDRLTADYAAATHLLADRDAQIERLMAELATLRASAASVQADQRAEIDAANAVIDELRAALTLTIDALTYQGTMGPTRRQRRLAAIDAARALRKGTT